MTTPAAAAAHQWKTPWRDSWRQGKTSAREFSRQYQLLEATTDLERELLQIRFDEEDRMRSIADAAAEQRAELTALSQDLAAAQAGTAIGESLGQGLVENAESLATAMDQAQSEFNDFLSNLPEDPFEQLFAQTGQKVAAALTNTIGTAIEGLISGADDLNEKLQAIASNLLRDLGSMFLRAGINAAAGPGGLFGPSGLPGFANGGTIPMGTTAVVGEDGPEMLVNPPQRHHRHPQQPLCGRCSGNVHPWLICELCGSRRSNGDGNRHCYWQRKCTGRFHGLRRSGRGVGTAIATATGNANAANASTAFAAAGAAMQMATTNMVTNISAQQQQQALAQASANAGTSTSHITLDTQVINSVEYATMDQVVKVGQQSAQQPGPTSSKT